jgi:hypothetical protein
MQDSELLKPYVNKYDLGPLIGRYCDKPTLKFKETDLSEPERQKLRLLRAIGVTDFVVERSIYSKKRPDIQDYTWIFTPKNIDLKPLKTNLGYVNPLKPMMDKIDSTHTKDPTFGLRLMSVKGMLASIRDITKGQDEELKSLVEAVITLVQTHRDGDGNPIQPNYIIPFFNAGLETIGINLNNKVNNNEGVRSVYSPRGGVLPKPMTLEELEKSMAARNATLPETKKSVQEIIPKEAVTKQGDMGEETIEEALRPTKHTVERIRAKRHVEETKIERPNIERTKVERPRIHREKKVKPPEETLASQVLKTMLPGLAGSGSSYQRLKIEEEKVEGLGEVTAKQLEKSITDIDLQSIVPLPVYLYTEYAAIFKTTANQFKEIYERRMKEYVGNSKWHASILESDHFYRTAKVLPKLFDKEAFNEQELSQLISTTEGRDISIKNIRKSIQPFVQIELVTCSEEKYSINKIFLKNKIQA